MELTTIVNITLSILSFLLAVISVITIIITIHQNGKMLRSTERQLEEMREEHRLSTQPILSLENEAFYINRPHFYYTPPEDAYEFLSTYQYEANLKNVSPATAICIDVSAYLVVERGNDEFILRTTSVRHNILSSNAASDTLYISFTGDSQCHLYESLRELEANKLPKLKIKMIYKNTCGGYFSSEKTVLLIPRDEDTQNIITWHTCIIGAPVEAKEAIDTMKKAPKGKEWNKVFETSKQVFDLKLGNSALDKISLKMIEIPQEYDFSSLSKEEFEGEMSKHGYDRYIHKQAACLSKK